MSIWQSSESCIYPHPLAVHAADQLSRPTLNISPTTSQRSTVKVTMIKERGEESIGLHGPSWDVYVHPEMLLEVSFGREPESQCYP